jgi:hypothetical protein
MEATDLRRALKVVAHILEVGERSHPAGSWRQDPPREHQRRAAAHLERALLNVWHGEDELGNALVRLLMAVELRERAAQAASVTR